MKMCLLSTMQTQDRPFISTDAVMQPEELIADEEDESVITKTMTDRGYRIEKLIREDLATHNHDRIAKVVKQLCKDFAYDVHHPYARTGGLIGLAAASIALGSVS
jgi:hypothetical protein